MGQHSTAFVNQEQQTAGDSSEQKEESADHATSRLTSNGVAIYENRTIRRDEYRRIPYFI
jgi:hypothetical protein